MAKPCRCNRLAPILAKPNTPRERGTRGGEGGGRTRSAHAHVKNRCRRLGQQLQELGRTRQAAEATADDRDAVCAMHGGGAAGGAFRGG